MAEQTWAEQRAQLDAEVKKDYLGNILSIGDEVVFMDVKYQTLRTGIIIKLNDKQAAIQDLEYLKGDYGYDKWGYGKTLRGYACIIRVKHWG